MVFSAPIERTSQHLQGGFDLDGVEFDPPTEGFGVQIGVVFAPVVERLGPGNLGGHGWISHERLQGRCGLRLGHVENQRHISIDRLDPPTCEHPDQGVLHPGTCPRQPGSTTIVELTESRVQDAGSACDVAGSGEETRCRLFFDFFWPPTIAPPVIRATTTTTRAMTMCSTLSKFTCISVLAGVFVVHILYKTPATVMLGVLVLPFSAARFYKKSQARLTKPPGPQSATIRQAPVMDMTRTDMRNQVTHLCFILGFAILLTHCLEAAEPKPVPLTPATKKAIGEITRLASSSKASHIRKALKGYTRVETSAKIPEAQRYAIHQALVESLRKNTHRSLERVARKLLKKPKPSNAIAQIVLMKALLSDSFPAPKKTRVEWLVRQVSAKTEQVQRWAVRVLGSLRTSEAVDALIQILDDEEVEGRAASILWSNVRAELYRVLGRAASGSTSLVIRRRWEQLGKKIPDSPDQGTDTSAGTTGVASFFGDPVSPRSVFVIDRSSSMNQKSVMKPRPGAEPSAPLSRIEIVKKELQAVLSKLITGFSFNIIAYDAGLQVWRKEGDIIRLHPVTDKSLKDAESFAGGLASGSGTNIHDSTQAALGVKGVYCVYLLSDGTPSVGPGSTNIVRRLRHLNYLKGVRIVTYGFRAAPNGAGADETFMQKIASEHAGWYRPLNHVKEDPPKEAEETVRTGDEHREPENAK